MKFSKAQQEILNALINDEEVLNVPQRMRAIQPLIDAGIVAMDNRQDKDGLWYSAGLKLV